MSHFTTGDAESALLERERFKWQMETLKSFTEEFERRTQLRGRRFAAYASDRIQDYLSPENVEFTREDLPLDQAIAFEDVNTTSIENYNLVTRLSNAMYSEYMAPKTNQA